MGAAEVPLREYIETLFKVYGARLDSYIEAHREVHEKLAEQATAAAVSLDRRLDAMNELRTQINSERGLYVTRDILDQRAQSFATRIDDQSHRIDLQFDEMSKRIGEMERAKSNMDGRITMTGVMLMAASVVINLMISIAVSLWKAR